MISRMQLVFFLFVVLFLLYEAGKVALGWLQWM